MKTRYCQLSDICLTAALGALVLVLVACEPAPKTKADWAHIDYEEIACGTNHAKPGCHSDHDIDAIGKGKGRR